MLKYTEIPIFCVCIRHIHQLNDMRNSVLDGWDIPFRIDGFLNNHVAAFICYLSILSYGKIQEN